MRNICGEIENFDKGYFDKCENGGKMRKVLVGLVSVGLMLEMLCACGSQTEKVIPNEVNNEKSPVEMEETERDVLPDKSEKVIEIPGLKSQYKLIVVNDQHIIVPDGDYISEKSEEIKQRVTMFSNSDGKTSQETWPEIVDAINAENPDGVILNGDMIDFFSEANLNCLMTDLKRIKAPVMYNRADHDLGIWYSDTYTDEDVQQKEKESWDMEEIMVQDFDEFLVVGINNNTSQLSEEGLERLKELWAEDKPIILTMHVPLKSQVNDGLSDASKAVWQDRALLWGTDCFYSPDEVTQQFLNMVFAEDSPVVAVIGAHLHFAYDDQLTEKIPQYVFDASFKGTVGVLTVK